MTKKFLLSPNLKAWQKNIYQSQKERKKAYHSLSDIEYPSLCDSSSVDSNLKKKLGYPGEFPYTRGIQPSMYRGRLWTMRQFAGFGSPKDTNQRFLYLLSHGQDGLSTAFDMPTLMGYDADHNLSRGEVGREGVSVSTIEDMAELFKGINLSSVTTSMTINCTAAPILAMYFALGQRQGLSLDELGGTIQNDILKEYIAQKEWICPPEPAVKLTCDVIEFCATSARKFNPISISGYHIREAGSTAVQELAFTIYNGISYVEHCLSRKLDIDSFAPRLSFFFDVHNDFFEEIAKFRAARRIWANLMTKRFKAKNKKSLLLRTHAQTAGVSLTAQQPMNNVARVALQALAAVLGGTQSLHTNSMDETLALPSDQAVKVALRTQQIIAEETGVADIIDPLGGSYFVEYLTDEIERQVLNYIKQLDEIGGMLNAIETGFVQKEIADASFQFQKELERGERVIVGVNKYVDDLEPTKIPLLKIDPEKERIQVEKVKKFKRERDSDKVKMYQTALKQCCLSGKNIMPLLIEAVDIGLTVGEVSDIYREVFGIYRDPGMF